MTKEKFNREVKNIFQKYGVKDNHIDTPFGLMYVRADKMNHNRLYSVFMRFENEFNIDMFYYLFSRHENINRFSKKWNIHNQDPEYVLDTLDERLDNLQYLLKEHGYLQHTKPELLF